MIGNAVNIRHLTLTFISRRTPAARLVAKSASNYEAPYRQMIYRTRLVPGVYGVTTEVTVAA